MENGKGKICVTGGSGFIGSWLIKRLLEADYSVNTTIRSDPEKKRDVSFLTTLPNASQKLHIFNADLSNPDGYIPAIEGCFGVFHLADPMDVEGREGEEVVTQRSIDGAQGILKACLSSKSVRRVIYASSTVAVISNGKNDVVEVMDESFWSDMDYSRGMTKSTYVVSKTLTEKAVLEFAQQNQNALDVVTLLPSFVLGPFICPKLPNSVRSSLAMLLGNKDQYCFLINSSMVHVDDVARALMFLLEHPCPKGRYICSAHTITIERMSQLLSSKYPEFQIPTTDSLQEIKGYKFPALSSKKLMNAGFDFKYGVEEMFDEAIQCCKEKGYL